MRISDWSSDVCSSDLGRFAMTSLPSNPGPVKLGLVIDLDICVGCHACAVNCKEWNTSGHSAPLTDNDPYGADPSGVWFNRIHSFEGAEERREGKEDVSTCKFRCSPNQ